MKKIFSKYPFFLVLLPVFIVIHIEKTYHFLIDYSFIHKELLITFAAPIVLYTISLLIYRKKDKAAIFSFILLFFFYFLGEIKNYLVNKTDFFSSYKFLFSSTFFIAVISYFIIKKKQNLSTVLLYINCLVTLAIIGDITSMLLSNTRQSSLSKTDITITDCADCQKPDIYYIIFDSYGSSPILKSEFDYDNTSQDSFLIKNGFQVLRNSHSNYNLTPFCIASTFSMNYLPNIDTNKQYFAIDYLNTVKKVHESPLFQLFANHGYSIVNHSIFDIDNFPTTIPRYDQWRIDKLYQQHNIIRKMYNEAGWNFPPWTRISFGTDPDESYVENRISHDSTTFDHLSATIKQPLSNTPKLVYAHILLPHSPYFFDSSGNRIEPSYTLTPKEDGQGYVEQVIYTNKLMKKLVDELMQNIKKPTIIVIQGDHGYRFYNHNKKKEEFANLNAIYLPEQYNTAIPDSVSGVNTFRFLINLIFKEKIPLLDTKSYYLKYSK